MSSSSSPTRRLVLAMAGLALVAVLFSKIRQFLRRRRFARLHGCKPVMNTPVKMPILGLDMMRSQLRAFKNHTLLEESYQRFQEYGNTFRIQILGRNVIATIEPENVKTVLALKFDDFSVGHRLETFGPLLGAGIFDTDGKHWATSRALIRPNFTRDQVADLAALESLIPDLFSRIPRDGKTTVDLQDIFFRYTIDSATDFLFGQAVGSLQEDSNAGDMTFAEAFSRAQEAIRTHSTLGILGCLYRDRKAEQANKFCRDFAGDIVDRALAAVQSQQEGKGDKYVFAHELARRTSDKKRILDELMNVLLAGRDTTASVLSNMFFMLAKNPSMWAKIRQEVAQLEGRLPTYGELKNLRYIRCCINESLRLHPVAPINDRAAIRDTILPVGGGPDGKSPVFVPKGTHVAYNVYTMHRRKDFYGPDSEDFRPERWESGKLQPRWEYLPFNGGPRICIGQQYALTELAYVTIRIAQEYSTLESRDPGPWEEHLTLTLSSRNGTRVCLTPVSK